MRLALPRPMIAALAMVSSSCLTAGCGGPDNPAIPNVPPTTAKADTEVPKARGTEAGPYGASKKYQDMMKK